MSTLAPKAAPIVCDPAKQEIKPDPTDKTPAPLTGKDARDQCNIVSSKADEMIALFGGIAKAGQAIMSLGIAPIFTTETQARTNVRTLLNIDLSNCEVSQLAQACSSEASSGQTNLIDMRCEYCQKNGCNLQDITQTNTSLVKQSCVMQSLLDILSRKKATQDVAVAMEIVQKALGGASATSNTDICNKFTVDQSSQKYTQTMQECIQKAYGDQTNKFYGCGDARGVAQTNFRDVTQNCMAGAETHSDTGTESGQTGDTSFKLDLSATGVAAASGASCCCIILIFLIWQFFFSG